LAAPDIAEDAEEELVAMLLEEVVIAAELEELVAIALLVVDVELEVDICDEALIVLPGAEEDEEVVGTFVWVEDEEVVVVDLEPSAT
jgi:hypothetical protein